MSLPKAAPHFITSFQPIQFWSEILEDPRYHGNRTAADVLRTGLKQVLTQYSLPKPFEQCGLQDCHQVHGTGYVLELEDGSIINVGHVCGRKKFGATTWDFVRGDYKRRENFKRQVELLKETQRGLQQYFMKLYSISERKPSPAALHEQFLKNLRSLSDDVHKRLAERLKKGNAVVSKIVTIKEEDSDGNVVKKTYSEPLFTIAGMNAVRSHADLNKIGPMLAQLHTFKAVNVDALDRDEVKAWARVFAGFEAKVRRYASVYDDCLRFGVPDNLANVRTLWKWPS